MLGLKHGTLFPYHCTKVNPQSSSTWPNVQSRRNNRCQKHLTWSSTKEGKKQRCPLLLRIHYPATLTCWNLMQKTMSCWKNFWMPTKKFWTTVRTSPPTKRNSCNSKHWRTVSSNSSAGDKYPKSSWAANAAKYPAKHSLQVQHTCHPKDVFPWISCHHQLQFWEINTGNKTGHFSELEPQILVWTVPKNCAHSDLSFDMSLNQMKNFFIFSCY